MNKKNINLHVSPKMRGYILSTESFDPHKYPDPKGQNKTFSIGYGHQLKPGENYEVIDEPKAKELFNDDVKDVESFIKTNFNIPLNQKMFDAIASLVFNVGPTSVGDSKFLRHHNNYDLNSAYSEFTWVKNTDLIPRREYEKSLWLEGVNSDPIYKKQFEQTISPEEAQKQKIAEEGSLLPAGHKKSYTINSVLKLADHYYINCLKARN